MRRPGLYAYLGILLLSLAAAYLTWTREPGKPGEKVAVLTCQRGDLLGLELKTKGRGVLISPKKSSYSGKSFWWVEMTTTPAGAGQSGQAQAGGSKIEGFKAGASLDEALGQFCPWRVLRNLGRLGEEKRLEFGLADSADRLVLKLKAGDRAFRIGTTSYSHPDRYLEDEKSGEIYLVSGQDLREIENPKSRFMERSLHSFSQDQVIRIRLRAGPREKEFVAKLDSGGKTADWADSSRPGEEKEIYKNWVQKYFALRILEYLLPPENSESMGCSGGPDADPALTLTFFDRQKEIGFSTFHRNTGQGGDAQYSVCTDNTDCLVSIPKVQVEGLLQDLEDVLSET